MVPCTPLCPCNYKSIISQTNNDCSFLSLTLAKLLLIFNISCENIFALSIVTAAVTIFSQKLTTTIIVMFLR